MACTIRVERFEETKDSTLSNLYLNGKKIGYALELPWQNNEPHQSRIPVGTYNATIKNVKDNSEEYESIQLSSVPGRNNIQFRMGNRPLDTDGDILIGTNKGLDRVWSSRQALDRVMSLASDGKIKVIIREKF